jgi:hypothetical protein
VQPVALAAVEWPTFGILFEVELYFAADAALHYGVTE